MEICYITGSVAFQSKWLSRPQALLGSLFMNNIPYGISKGQTDHVNSSIKFEENDLNIKLILEDHFGSLHNLYIPHVFSQGYLIRLWELNNDLRYNFKNLVEGIRQLLSLANIKCQVCLGSMVQGGLIGSLLGKLRDNCLFVYDDMDAYFLFYSFPFRTLVYLFERFIISHADLVFSVSRVLKNFREKYFKPKKIYWLPNGVNNKLFESSWVKRKNEISNFFNKKIKRIILVYSGSLDPFTWGVTVLLDVIKILKSRYKNASLILIGDGIYKRFINKEIKKRGLRDHVKLVGKVKHSRLPFYFSHAMFGMAIGMPNSAAEFADPIKIREYMSAGIPVIGSNVGEIPIIIRESGGGLYSPIDPEEIAYNIVQLSSNKREYIELMQNARKYALKFDWHLLSKKFFKIIKNEVQYSSG